MSEDDSHTYSLGAALKRRLRHAISGTVNRWAANILAPFSSTDFSTVTEVCIYVRTYIIYTLQGKVYLIRSGYLVGHQLNIRKYIQQVVCCINIRSVTYNSSIKQTSCMTKIKGKFLGELVSNSHKNLPLYRQ